MVGKPPRTRDVRRRSATRPTVTRIYARCAARTFQDANQCYAYQVASSRKKTVARVEEVGNVSPRVDAVPQRHHGYKQQRSLQTFDRLLTAAEELMSEKPFDEVSINDICTRAGHSVGAFYRRFESRDGLLHVLH